MFGLSIEKIILIAVIAAVVVGPERLPAYSRGLSSGIRKLKAWLDSGKERLESEVGQDIDWRQLNPRQYDPRRIIKNALIPVASEVSAVAPPIPSAENSATEPDTRNYSTPSKPRPSAKRDAIAHHDPHAPQGAAGNVADSAESLAPISVGTDTTSVPVAKPEGTNE